MRKTIVGTVAATLCLGLSLGMTGAAKAQEAVEYATISSQSSSGITGFARRGGSRSLFQATNSRLRGSATRGRMSLNRSNFRNMTGRTQYAGLRSMWRKEDRRKYTGQVCETVEAGVRVLRPRCR